MSDAAPIDVEMVRALANLQGLRPPEEDLEPLAAALAAQLAAALRILERYGEVEVEPPLVFDARWE
jgi:hypothetical protein